MGKTYKRYPIGYHRTPRGSKQAQIQGARNKAIPPDAWDDKAYDDQCWIPCELGRRFYKAGMSREEAIQKIRKKFRLSQREALDATYCWSNEFKGKEEYAKEAFDRRPLEEQVAIRLRYDNLVDWHQELLREE